MPDLDTLLARAEERLRDAQMRYQQAQQVVNDLAPQIMHLQGMIAAYRSLRSENDTPVQLDSEVSH